MRPADSYDMFEYARRADVTKYLTWQPHPSREYTRDYLDLVGKCYRNGEFFDWAVVWREGFFFEKMIGTCGFTRFDFANNSAELGYVINPEYRGRGIAPEALKRVIEFGFYELSLNRLEAKYIVGNDASRRVMEKVGMRFEGINRGSLLLRGEYRDVGVCSILASDYVK
jgi:ribosomal-protein-alanine N-acetyltransferase